MRFANGQILLPDRLFTGSLKVENGLIVKSETKSVPLRHQDVDLEGGFLSPGFIDLHIHGAVGRDTMEATEEACRAITGYHLTGGTTSLTLTTMTASPAAILAALKTIQPLFNKSIGGSRIVGVHVEGPFISPKRAGAQDPSFIRNPTRTEYQKILKFGKLITQMTVAPEIPGALSLIAALRKNGSIASGGHTDAAEPDLEKGLKAGMNQATHTFNAMSTITKNGPFRLAGMIEFALAKDQIMCELIADGVHVP
ncbi:MAG: N-acetylglucosamine-6-phosphate deacetylase, partial [Verrucomicrobiales bacterium]|nr:N-acetylglucosamine-6-phosphate deacetylase [Verrucomicrobiales bacterium]